MRQPSGTRTFVSWEVWADVMTATIAGRARRQHPTDVSARVEFFDREIDRLPQPWKVKRQ
jgi:hypothetical protein